MPKSADGKRFTDEATVEYGLAVTAYSEKLDSLAVAKCTSEVVLKEHVLSAISELTASSAESAGLKTLLDWVKRIAFLFIGFSVVQASNVLNQEDIEKGSVVWLVIDVVVAAAMLGIALAADIPPVRRLISKAG